jgi:hypothetical protein
VEAAAGTIGGKSEGEVENEALPSASDNVVSESEAKDGWRTGAEADVEVEILLMSE